MKALLISGAPMTGVVATLSTTTEGVVITQPYTTYPNIPASGNGTNFTPFQISVLPSFVCGTPITNEPIVSGGNYNVTNSSGSPNSQFYRLYKQ